jgi:transposase
MARGSAVNDTSRSWVVDCAGVRADIGEANRFGCGKQIASYLGLVPEEESSGERRRLGHISKQGNSLLRFLLVEAAQVTVRSDPRWRNQFFHLAMRRGRKIAKVAMARRLAVGLYWIWRRGWNYEQLENFGSHAGSLEIAMVCSKSPT